MNTQLNFQETATDQFKQCNHCKKILPKSAFNKNKNYADGLRKDCRECSRLASKRTYHKYSVRLNQHSKDYNQKVRYQALSHYSDGGAPACACCHETHIEFLVIDHIHGGGHQHRQSVGSIYIWLIKNNYPDGFRVLCHNCNQALGLYGYCPHHQLTTETLMAESTL